MAIGGRHDGAAAAATADDLDGEVRDGHDRRDPEANEHDVRRDRAAPYGGGKQDVAAATYNCALGPFLRNDGMIFQSVGFAGPLITGVALRAHPG